ncbi:MAG: hypothetical protein C0490_03955 [Marivirga sp.]|nr:hypothetical protein [Marivirga sp.]
MAYSIHQHLTYNLWANTKVADTLRIIDNSLYFQENNSSFSSIAKTVLHLWGAQFIWLTRMQGESLSEWPSANVTDKEEALDGLIASSSALVSFVKLKDESFLKSMYAYKNMKGEPFVDPYEDTLFHVVNHGTYHRGQIITMLRQGGVATVPSTDLIHYLRTLRN